MKRFFHLMIVVIVAITACSKVNDIDERLNQLEQTVSDLKAQTTAGAFITSVETTADGITFHLSNGQKYNVSNGKDGEAVIANITIEDNYVVITLKNGEIMKLSYQNPLSLVSLELIPDYTDGSVKNVSVVKQTEFTKYLFSLSVAVIPDKYTDLLADTSKFLGKASFVPVKTKAGLGIGSFELTPNVVTSNGSRLDMTFELDSLIASKILNRNLSVSYSISDKEGIHGAATSFVPVSSDNGESVSAGVSLLPGKFSVSNSKQVQFSRGNLYYDNSSFRFENNQYSAETKLYFWLHLSHFLWSKSSAVAIQREYDDPTASKSDLLFTNYEDFTVAGETDKYRALTNEEWTYLISGRNNASQKMGFATVGGSRIAGQNVNGMPGLIILPDTFTDPKTNNGSKPFANVSTNGWEANVYIAGNEWNAMEKAGAVFLPAVGRRKPDDLLVSESGDAGYYWSASSSKASAATMYRLYFNCYGSIHALACDHRDYALCIRLVKDVK